MKALILSSLLGATLSSNVFAQDLTELDRQLNIMSGVINTALKQDIGKSGLRYRGITATYLAKQGVVFTLNTSHKVRVFDFDLGGLISSVSMPSAPSASESYTTIVTDEDMEFVVERDWEEAAEHIVHRVERIMSETNEKLRDFRSDQREIEWEIREIERRNRDLEFELRSSDKERMKEVKEEIKELAEERERLENREAELKQYATELAKEKQQELDKQKAAKEEAYKTFLANFEGSIGDTLCSFGAGLRELPNDEHITFILKDFSHNDQGNASDRVYIFSKKSVKRCVTEDISPSEMLANAKVYAF